MAKTKSSVEELVKWTLLQHCDESEITPTASFVDDLGCDCLDVVELVMAFEEKLDISIPDEDMDKLKTVGDAIAYLKEKVDG